MEFCDADNLRLVCINPFVIVLACALCAWLGWNMRGEREDDDDSGF